MNISNEKSEQPKVPNLYKTTINTEWKIWIKTQLKKKYA